MGSSDLGNTSEEETTTLQDDGKREVLLTQYRLTRQDLRQKTDRNDRRLVRGVILLGLILGYAFETDTKILVIFIPLIVGFLFTLGLQRWTDVNFLERQCLDIEEKLGRDGLEEFGWTEKYGRLKVEKKEKEINGDRFWLTHKFPSQVGYLVGTVIYILFLAYSLYLLTDRPLLLAGVGIFYAVFTIVLYFVWESEKHTRDKLKKSSFENDKLSCEK